MFFWRKSVCEKLFLFFSPMLGTNARLDVTFHAHHTHTHVDWCLLRLEKGDAARATRERRKRAHRGLRISYTWQSRFSLPQATGKYRASVRANAVSARSQRASAAFFTQKERPKILKGAKMTQKRECLFSPTNFRVRAHLPKNHHTLQK